LFEGAETCTGEFALRNGVNEYAEALGRAVVVGSAVDPEAAHAERAAAATTVTAPRRTVTA